MSCVTKKYVDTRGGWNKTHVLLGCFLYQKITKNMKTIDMMDRKTTLFLKSLSTYYALGFICKNSTWGTGSDLW